MMILGLRPGPRIIPKVPISQEIIGTFGVILPKLFRESVRRCSGTVLGGPGDAPRTLPEGFWRHFGIPCPRKSVAKTFAKIEKKIS